MLIGGLQKISLIDYPEHVAAIIFTQGCNFRCHFCYNPQLVVPKDYSQTISENSLFGFLKKRRGKLDGVVITGGEPTVHRDLPVFIAMIKKLGYLVKLDSNGTNPEMLAGLIKERLIDYIAMDIKAPLKKYGDVVGTRVSLDKIKKSVKIIINSRLPYEFRTTVMPVFHKPEDIELMGVLIKGAQKWYLQKFLSLPELVDEKFKSEKSYNHKKMEEMAVIGRAYVKQCIVR